MMISTITAKKIVQEIGTVLNRTVFFADTNGVIIAGTDEKRIGSEHQLAKKLILDSKDEIIENSQAVFAFDAKQDIYGYICVEGDTAGISASIPLLQKTCALIASTIEDIDTSALQRRIENRFLHTWLFGKNTSITSEMIEFAAGMNIDITMPRRFYAFTPVIPKDDTDSKENCQIRIDSAIREAADLARQVRNGLALIEGTILMCSCGETEDEKIFALVEDIREKIERKYKLFLCAGIDSGSRGYAHVEDECQKAQKAAVVSARSPKKETRFYDSINMEIFSNYIPTEVKEMYIRRVFRNIPTFEIRDWIYLLNAYYNHEGSITKAATELGIPINTLQYKLRKLYSKTGYDPRSIRFSSLFYNALHFYSDIKDQK